MAALFPVTSMSSTDTEHCVWIGRHHGAQRARVFISRSVRMIASSLRFEAPRSGVHKSNVLSRDRPSRSLSERRVGYCTAYTSASCVCFVCFSSLVLWLFSCFFFCVCWLCQCSPLLF